jgi:hypothetical protein
MADESFRFWQRFCFCAFSLRVSVFWKRIETKRKLTKHENTEFDHGNRPHLIGILIPWAHEVAWKEKKRSSEALSSEL